jgi:hypothetical protein
VTTYYVVDFGSSLASFGAAHDLVNAIADLGYRPSAAGGRVRVPEAAVAALRQLPAGTDGAIRDEPWAALTGDDEGIMPCVRMGGYTYPLWPESAGPKIATRRAVAQVTPRAEPGEQGLYGSGAHPAGDQDGPADMTMYGRHRGDER